jgi:hypothetical protein
MMPRIAYPYYLLALVATSVAVFFVMKKIDKRSFYHHYFRVIEDVELRNSQAVETLPDLLAEVNHHSLHLPVGVPTLLQWLLSWLSVKVGVWLMVPLIWLRMFRPHPAFTWANTQRWRIVPTRAP